MKGLSLDLNFLEQQKLYIGDALNHLHKVEVCANPTDLVIVTPQTPAGPRAEGGGRTNQDVLNAGSQTAPQLVDSSPSEDYEDRNSDILHSKVHFLLIIIFILTLALILLASLALSAYALHLIAQTNEKMGDLSSSQLHQKYLEEMREWKAVIQGLLPHRSALQVE